jgi:hypothetical protein
VHANLLFLEADRVDHNIVCEQRLHQRPRKPLRLNRNGKAVTARSVGAWEPYSAAGTGVLAAGWVRPVRHDGGRPEYPVSTREVRGGCDMTGGRPGVCWDRIAWQGCAQSRVQM